MLKRLGMEPGEEAVVVRPKHPSPFRCSWPPPPSVELRVGTDADLGPKRVFRHHEGGTVGESEYGRDRDGITPEVVLGPIRIAVIQRATHLGHPKASGEPGRLGEHGGEVRHRADTKPTHRFAAALLNHPHHRTVHVLGLGRDVGRDQMRHDQRRGTW